MDIKINVNGQHLKILYSNKNFVSGSQKFVCFAFKLSDEWNDLTVYAQFSQNGKSYNVYLDSENKVFLPAEIQCGTCTLALRGTRGNVVAVTESLQLYVIDNPIQGGVEATGVTPTLYEQLVDKVNSLLDDNQVIVQTTERVLQEYLEDDKFAAMSIGDGSIAVQKLSPDAIVTGAEILEYLGLNSEE